ncbi:MAG: hypothetical protein WA653_22140 [Candidatus Sulfotelmatobacter sp.]
MRRALLQVASIAFILGIYSFPALKTRAELGSAILPPIFAGDLSMYLNLANLKTLPPGQILNPYYLVPVPSNGTAYLKFRLGSSLFGAWDKMLGESIWLAMFTWNLFWWASLCVAAIWLFERCLPAHSATIGLMGLGLLMLVNTGMLKPLLAAWIHLPGLAGFASLELPDMRAFSPQIPLPLLVVYLGLQMEALRKRSAYPWVAMAGLQLLALACFPYATMVMAGLTFVSLLGQIFSSGLRKSWLLPLAYGAACAVADAAFLMRGSMNIYASHVSLIHFQPGLLPHLARGTWLLLGLLTVAVAISKSIPLEVKLPLAGLGATVMVLMLGDAFVPSTVLLLSGHAGYFLHTTFTLLVMFLISAAFASHRARGPQIKVAAGIAVGLIALNGILVSAGLNRTFLPMNRAQAELAQLLSSLHPAEGDLLLARTRSVDDTLCGWGALLFDGPVLFCTDAMTMLTPSQNQTEQSFRQAVYLYLSGKDSRYLQRIVDDPNPQPMYQLGYWAEAISLSREEQNDGRKAIRADLLPVLKQVESQDVAVKTFFHQFRRVVVIDNLQNPTFSSARLALFLKPVSELHLEYLTLHSYVPL